MRIVAEITNVFTDEDPRVSNARLPVKVKMTIYESGNTHELTLCSSKALALKLQDLIKEELLVWV